MSGPLLPPLAAAGGARAAGRQGPGASSESLGSREWPAGPDVSPGGPQQVLRGLHSPRVQLPRSSNQVFSSFGDSSPGPSSPSSPSSPRCGRATCGRSWAALRFSRRLGRASTAQQPQRPLGGCGGGGSRGGGCGLGRLCFGSQGALSPVLARAPSQAVLEEEGSPELEPGREEEGGAAEYARQRSYELFSAGGLPLMQRLGSVLSSGALGGSRASLAEPLLGACCTEKAPEEAGAEEAPRPKKEARFAPEPCQKTRYKVLSKARYASSQLFAQTLADPEEIGSFLAPWMNRLNDILVFLQWGCANFYSCDLHRIWFSVDEEHMKLERSTITTKWLKELTRALAMSCVAMIVFPLRFIVAVPFYLFVARHTRDTDIAAQRAQKMRSLCLQLAPVFAGCCLSGRMLVRAYGSQVGLSTPEQELKYRMALNPDVGSLAYVELVAPFRALLILIALEVIWKQRRDMSYVVNVIRHHLLVDEAIGRSSGRVVFGPVVDSEGGPGGAALPWLLGEVPAADGTLVTRLELHRRDVERQWRDLRAGTGAISEIADKEADMFFRSGMQDLLEQRMDTLIKIEDMLKRMQVEGVSSEPVPLDYGDLVEVLCAGYRHHFQEEVVALHKPDRISWGTFAIALMYVFIPTVSMLWQGRILRRWSPGVADVAEIPYLAPLSAVASFLMLRALFSSLGSACGDLLNSHEALVILHRTASAHHRRQAEFERYEQMASRHGTKIFNKFGEVRRKSLLLFDDEMVKCNSIGSDIQAPDMQDLFQPPEWRKRVKFKACLMRGADCHVSISHKHRYDSIMKRVYGVESKEACHSFVELDLRATDQLRMWWIVRSSIEAGLLRHKIFAELLLLCTLVLLALLIGFSVVWLGFVGHAVTSHFMCAWEVLFLGIATLRLVKACARLNSILESDSKRLSLIYNDIVQEISNRDAKCEQEQRDQQRDRLGGGPAGASHSTCWGPAGGGGLISRSASHAPHPQGAAETGLGRAAAALYARRRPALQLLKIYIDHLDRDHRPLQLCGITINHAAVSRGYLLVFSAICTGVVRASASVLLNLKTADAPF